MLSVLAAVYMLALSGSKASCLVAFHPNLYFPERGGTLVKEFSDITPGIDFDEVIASWNVDHADGSSLLIEARAHGADFVSKWYTMARWALDDNGGPRESVKGQGDAMGTVDTDTLALRSAGKAVDVRLTLHNTAAEEGATLKFFSLSFSRRTTAAPDRPSRSAAWGKTIDVPQRAQNNYPNGGVLCSPTSVSMTLSHYADVLKRPELNKDVPEVEYHVWDPVYKGAGNWPFNTAYAGSFSGMVSYVARFDSIQDLESWTAAGFPVICSVSFDMLRGLPLSATESGHLVVLVGFDDLGNPVINDPAFKDQVHRTYKRSDFERAWAYSRKTVYLVYPEAAAIPQTPSGLWDVSTKS